MIIEQYNNDVQVSGNMETQEFTIKADDGKLFHILSNLYSNPVGAVVRELSTNCLDAHKMAETDEPFHIILNDSIEYDYFIKFRDFGIGMDHQTITQIFTKYGESTKIHSNEVTGCLGLGSKSPFTISDSFTISNIFQGMKTIYGVTKNERNVPMIVIFDTYPTDERNGLEITVPLEKDFRSTITDHIKQELLFFKNKPKVFVGDEEIKIWENETTTEINRLYDSGDKILFSSESSIIRQGQMSVIQGEVRYNLNIKQFFDTHIKIDNSLELWETSKEGKISSATLNLTKKILDTALEHYNHGKTSIIYLADMGEVSFAPSREELMFDTRTITNIMNNFISFVKEFYDKLLKAANSFDCPLELRNAVTNNTNVCNKYDPIWVRMLYSSRYIISQDGKINNTLNSYDNKRLKYLSKNPFIQTIYRFVPNRNHSTLVKKNIYTPKINDTKRYVSTKYLGHSFFNTLTQGTMARIILVNLNDKAQSRQVKKFIKYMTVANQYMAKSFIIIEHTFKQNAQKYLQKMMGITDFYFVDINALPKTIKSVDLKTKQVVEKSDIFLSKQTIEKNGFKQSTINLADIDDETVYVVTNRDDIEYDQFDDFAKKLLTLPINNSSVSGFINTLVNLFKELNIDHKLKLVFVSKSVFTRCKTTFKKNNILHLNDVLLDIFKNNPKKSFKYVDKILDSTIYDRVGGFLLLTAYFHYISNPVKHADRINRFNKFIYSFDTGNSDCHTFKVDNFKNLFDSPNKKNIFDFAVNKFFDECLYYFENSNDKYIKLENNILSNDNIRDSLIEIGYTFTKTLSIPKFLYDDIRSETGYSYDTAWSYFSQTSRFTQIKRYYFETLYRVFFTNHKNEFFEKVGLKD
jgi:hypothetical protein